jgi:arabinoxylan arabinofuranohydrolase
MRPSDGVDPRKNLAMASIVSLAVTVVSTFLVVPICRADNPIIQTKFTADPAPLVVGDTVYLYTSHDDDNATGFTMFNWLLYSSTDMVNWTDHGIVAGVAAPNKTFSWADGVNAWAPQAIARNGKFYLYVPTPLAGHMVIGVAVASAPTGPFVDAIGAPLINNPSSIDDIDPTVFIDNDGQAYLYWGHQPPVFYVKLNQDMISYSGGIVQLTRPQTYEEGPWFYRRNDNYYLAFASTCCPEGIGYAMSSSPTGPWTYKGSIMDGNAASSGNHPGIIDFMGNSYVFGFNYALNAALTTVHRERRSICVEKFSYAVDGTIPKLPFWSTTGAPQIGHLNPYVQTEAETMAWSQGLKTETCSEGGMDVTAIETGDFIKVKGVDFGAGASSVDVRVASAGGGGNIEIRLDSQTGTLAGTCAVSGTGGAQTWATRTCPVSGASGAHDLYFVFTGGAGSSLFNFNWWRFAAKDSGRDAAAIDSGAADAAGAGGTAGNVGSGGRQEPGTGGRAGSGGASGVGGNAAGGAGGLATATGGAPGGGATGGAAGSNARGGGAAGCSCVVGGAPESGLGLFGVVVALATFGCLRRRRQPRQQQSVTSGTPFKAGGEPPRSRRSPVAS